jgi:hypothetical protein
MRLAPIQKFAWLYAAMAFGVVAIGYVPGATTSGLLFGLFKIDPVDDVIHGLTAVAAALAAWTSARVSVLFFWTFIALYGLDATLGLLLQRGLLDLTALSVPGGSPDFGLTTWLINLPHILLVALALGIVLRFGKTKTGQE